MHYLARETSVHVGQSGASPLSRRLLAGRKKFALYERKVFAIINSFAIMEQCRRARVEPVSPVRAGVGVHSRHEARVSARALFSWPRPTRPNWQSHACVQEKEVAVDYDGRPNGLAGETMHAFRRRADI